VNLLLFLAALPGNLLRIRRIIRSQAIDVVHVDGVTNFVPALAAWLSRIPVVWSYNDHPPRALKRFLLPLAAVLASRVIVQGEGLKRSRTAAYPRLYSKTTVLYSSVDTVGLVPDAYDAARRRSIRRELGVPSDGVLIGTVGNLNRFKGHTYFLRAAARICRQVDSARFVIVGRRLDTDATYAEHLQELAKRLGLADRVTFTGFREDIPAILSALDLFVLPSILESCPVALLEAMAMKVPVVATDVGAVGEMVSHGQTGFIVPPGDAEALAEAVLAVRAMSPEQVIGMVEAARKGVEERFGVATIAEQQLQVYERVCRPCIPHA